MWKNKTWTGQVTAILHPVYVMSFGDVKVIESRHPFIPLYENPLPDIIVPVSTEWAIGRTMKSFNFLVESITLEDADLVETCGAYMCDGQHAEEVKCPAMCVGAPPSLILEASICAGQALRNVTYRSTKFTQFFLAPDAMEVSF